MAEANSSLLDWNPMAVAHNDPHFNSYNEGPGRNFQASGGAARDNTKLYVKNVPREVTEAGLRNMFTNVAGADPVRLHIPTPLANYPHYYAFINFNSNSEASKAIEKLHKKPPFFLEVSFQKPRNDFSGRNPYTRQFDDLAPRLDSPPSQCPPPNPSGVINWKGVQSAGHDDEQARELDQAWPDPKDAFIEPRRAGFYDPNGGASGQADLVLKQNTGLAVNLNISAGADGRQVSYGRGYFPPAPRVGGPINSLLGDYQPPSNAVMRGSLVSAPAAQAPTALASCAQGPPVSASVVPQPCHSCYQPAVQVCALCREVRYCSRICSSKHWIAHRHVCILHCKPPGLELVKNADEPIAVATKPPEAVAAPHAAVVKAVSPAKPAPTQLAGSNQTPQTRSHGIDNYEDLPAGKYTAVTVAVPDGSTGWVAVDSRNDHCYEMVMAITERNDLAAIAVPREGDYVAAVFCGEWFRARVMKTAPLTVFYVDYGNTEQLTLDQIRSLPAEYLQEPAQAVQIRVMPSPAGTRRTLAENQQLCVCPLRKVNGITDVKMEADDQVAASKNSTMVELPGKSIEEFKCLQNLQPFTKDEAIKVFFVCKDNGEFFVQPVASAEWLREMLTEFSLLDVSFAMKPCANIAVGQLVAAKYEEDWSRCKILSIENNNLKLVYIDYGNQTTVAKSDVRELPKKYTNIPGQCVKVSFTPDTPAEVIKLGEFTVFLAALSTENSDGSVIVRANLLE